MTVLSFWLGDSITSDLFEIAAIASKAKVSKLTNLDFDRFEVAVGEQVHGAVRLLIVQGD